MKWMQISQVNPSVILPLSRFSQSRVLVSARHLKKLSVIIARLMIKSGKRSDATLTEGRPQNLKNCSVVKFREFKNVSSLLSIMGINTQHCKQVTCAGALEPSLENLASLKVAIKSVRIR